MKPYCHYQCDLAQGTADFRTSVSRGIEIYESLRGHTTGFAVPTYIIDAVGGGGKMPVFPSHAISQARGRIVLRDYEGIISRCAEPDVYVEGQCHCEECEYERKRLGVAGMLSDEHGTTLSEVWDARMQKIVDRKNRTVDDFAAAKVHDWADAH